MNALWSGAEKVGWRAWYSFLEWYAGRQGARFTVMNWGYDDGAVRVSEDDPERFPLQLYAALLDGVAVRDRVLVDVSCGRGGGIAWAQRTLNPARAIGIDFTARQVDLCRRTFGKAQPGLEFLHGDAENLPLPDGSVDVVISVEASHCYRDQQRFLDEARRVLRPGGVLCWTDFAPAERAAEQARWVRERFEVLEDRDITREVLSAMRADRPRRREIIELHGARALQPLLLNFAAADDACDTVQRFESGRAVYFLRRLRRS